MIDYSREYHEALRYQHEGPRTFRERCRDEYEQDQFGQAISEDDKDYEQTDNE